ncbi:glycosyltransferase family 4 protein [Streptomyces sp. NBC_01007]|nr:glycosyltransferase family 4 protein [Streptomyces sp. NBC_01007]
MFETDFLPSAWVARAREVDEIWVPSAHNVETFADAGVSRSKLRILHEPLDIEVFSQSVAQRRVDVEEFVFLSVFTWQLRKGWDVLLRAYFEEFDATDHVLLTLRCAPFAFGNEGRNSILSCIRDLRAKFGGTDPPPVRLVETHLKESELADLYAASDCFVLPSRGEGWARPLMEAMAIGVPVIATGWGGHTEFATAANARLVSYELVPVSSAAEYEYKLFAGHRWAEPSISHLKHEMRAASRAGKGKRNYVSAVSVREKFDCARIARKAIDFLRAPVV